MKRPSKFFLAILLLTVAPAKGSDYPFGGICDPISREKVKTIASTALKGMGFHFTKGQQACAHNIQIVVEGVDTYLKISTRRGDGLGNIRQSEADPTKTVRSSGSPDHSDIETGRRRFEIAAVNGRRFPVGKLW